MRTLGTKTAALAAALLLGLARPAPAAMRPHGTQRALLASVGDIHDALIVLLSQDPRIAIQDGKDVVRASWLDGTQPTTLTAYLTPGPSGDQSVLELVCEGPRSSHERRQIERQWLDRIPESVKYYGLQLPPDLRSPLDEGPRAQLPDEVPSVDRFRRY